MAVMTLVNTINNPQYTNRVAVGLDKAGNFLMYPASLFLGQLAKIIRPLKPGHFDQLDSILKELAMRILRVFLCLIFIPLISFGMIGGMLWTMASPLRSQFVVIHPGKVKLRDGENIKQLKIVT